MYSFKYLLDPHHISKKNHFLIFFAVLTILSLITLLSYQPLCPGHDFLFHYRRFEALTEGLANPFLIYLDYAAMNNYGYFSKAFYPDLILVPFALIGRITGTVFAYQFMIFSMNILCGVFTYFAVNRIYKNTFVASISAILFTFSTYRLLDIYHRSSLGEVLSLTFLPIVMLGLYEIIKGDYRKWYILAIGYSLQIFSHVISSVLLFITVIILLAVYHKPLLKEPKRFYYLLLAGFVTLIISGYFLFPLTEQIFSDSFYFQTQKIMSNISEGSLKINWIIWGLFSGIIQPKQIFIPGIGLLLTIAVCSRLFVYTKTKQLKDTDIVTLIGLVFILISSSVFPWSYFPFNKLNFIQFPWRFYEFSTFFFAAAGGYYLSLALKTNIRLFTGGLLFTVLTIFVIINDAQLYKEVRCNNEIDQEFYSFHIGGGQEYIPSKVPFPASDFIQKRGDLVKTKHEETLINNFKREKESLELNIETSKREELELPLIFYKGYKATINEKEIYPTESNNGLVRIDVEESGRLKVFYAGTLTQKMSYIITVLSIIALCVYIFREKRKKHYNINN